MESTTLGVCHEKSQQKDNSILMQPCTKLLILDETNLDSLLCPMPYSEYKVVDFINQVLISRMEVVC